MDEFFTIPSIVNYCLDQLDLNNYNLIIEPSAGNGAFVKELNKRVPNISKLYFDINPQHSEIKKQDFLEWNNWPLIDNILVVGNPPFGKNSSLAIKFFNKSALFAQTIAFIVPKTFNKISIHNRLNKNFHLIFNENLKLDAFIYNNNSYSVPTCFQIWQKRNDIRETIIIEPLKSFEYTTPDKADFAIRRVGFYAGKINLHPELTNTNTHYYLKINKKELTIKKIRNLLSTYTFDCVKNTAGSRSLSKLELNSILNKLFP